MEKQLFTTGQIGDLLQESPDRVGYMIRKHRIKPARRIGAFRLFDLRQVELIRRYLYDIQIRKDR